MGGYALVFPGQGSQAVGMGRELWENHPEAREVFAEAEAALGFPLGRLCFEGPEEELKKTENAQPAILTVSVAAYRVLRAAYPRLAPLMVAGHSFGEYSALVAAEALSFAAAVRLVRRRGEIMAAALPLGAGTMAAILGLGGKSLAQVLREAQRLGVVEPATLNCPGQVVVAGEAAAVAEAGRLALAAGASRVVPLAVSGPFHSSLMRGAAEEFARELAKVDLRPARVPVVANVTAKPVTDPEEIRRLLVEQIYSPVRWEESVRFMLAAGVEAFLELGPGRVLAGLIHRISREAKTIGLGDEAGLKEALAFLGEV
ncbi:MAG: ACP S-malonyltransferase [Bacillota bacterium]